MPEEKTSSNPVVLRKRDFLLAFVVLAAALLIFLALTPKSGDLTAVVEQGGQVLYRIPLREVQSSYTIQVEGEFPAVLLIDPDGVSFQSATCPDQVCVRTGKLIRAGQAAACLPARLTLRLEGAERQVDGYTG